MTIVYSLLLLFVFRISISAGAKKSYIVHMNPNLKPRSYPTHRDWHSAALSTATAASAPEPVSLLYSYASSLPGFAATLENHEIDQLLKSDGVVDVYEDKLFTLHTTRSPEFLGLESANFVGYSTVLDRASHDVIIGVLDTGVWPESRSFDDTGIPPVPERWKGKCESGPDFSPKLCNRKLIGARVFRNGFRASIGFGGGTILEEHVSPRDVDGHGTHTASTAAGSAVGNASLFGYARGTARGMATHARVASYKVCGTSGCLTSDILAGMDRAMEDGVDVLSLSLGGGPAPFDRDALAIATFAAVKRGIFVTCSGGNDGPAPASVSNLAPWVMTVGAGTMDREFPAYVSLGGGKINFTGVSLYSGPGMGTKPVRLVYFRAANTSSNLCFAGTLDPKLVRGNVVLCDRGVTPRTEKGEVVKKAGGVGMVLANDADHGEELLADSHLLPALGIGKKTGDKIRAYIYTDTNPTALISSGETVLNVKPSPVVAAFSSRGPNTVSPAILKPDVIGPGVNILAGWTDAVGPTTLEDDKRQTDFNILSGTSMSSPHIGGLAALIKAAHPNWSPSAIKSALMTTAYDVDTTNSPLRDAATGLLSTPYAHGAGHVSPRRALSPGLIYDISISQYVAFLCSLNYSLAQVKMVVNLPRVNCSSKLRGPGDLNYPSFSVVFGASRVVRHTREVTNVGETESVYHVAVRAPKAVDVAVEPESLVFRNVGEKRKYTVTFVSKKGAKLKHDFGSLVWKNGRNHVKSPIAFTWLPSSY